MKNLIEVSVDSIRIHMPTAQHLVILKEKEADRYLPIWIGSFEAQAIATKISGNALGRPLTHDLMATAFGDLGISVKRIVVTRLADQVFYARLYVKQNGRDLDFDARPSDAIALAVRVECPIFVASEVMESAGIIPEADEIDGDKDKGETVVDEERLAVFRDFVNSLDLPELPDEPGAKDAATISRFKASGHDRFRRPLVDTSSPHHPRKPELRSKRQFREGGARAPPVPSSVDIRLRVEHERLRGFGPAKHPAQDQVSRQEDADRVREHQQGQRSA